MQKNNYHIPFKCYFWIFPSTILGCGRDFLTACVSLHLTGTGRTNQSEILIDLVGLDIEGISLPKQQPPSSSLSIPADLLCGSAATDPQSPSPSAPSTALSLLDEELLSLGKTQNNVVEFFFFIVTLQINCLRKSYLHIDMTHFCSFTGLNEPVFVPSKSTHVNLNNHLPSLQVF